MCNIGRVTEAQSDSLMIDCNSVSSDVYSLGRYGRYAIHVQPAPTQHRARYTFLSTRNVRGKTLRHKESCLRVHGRELGVVGSMVVAAVAMAVARDWK